MNLSFQEVAKILLKHGAIIDVELGASKNKLTPLLIASSMGGLEFVRLLVSHGANPLYKGIMSGSSYPLHNTRQHLSYDDCLEDKREDLSGLFCAVLCNMIVHVWRIRGKIYQDCSVMYCVVVVAVVVERTD